MAIAQGIQKALTFKKQTGLGVAAAGSGGQVMRREQSKFDLNKEHFENNEIVTHQQSTGVTAGARKVTGSVNGVLSMNTYSTIIASLLRKPFSATTPITAAGLTIAGSAGAWTITRTAGSYLTDGIKIGDVIRLSVGTLNALNITKNLLVTALTATIATCRVVNASLLAAEGPITGCTVTVVGKKCIAPLTGQTQEYWTVEEWQADIARSDLYTDVVVGSVDIGLASKGNATFASSYAGLQRTSGTVQILTTPTAATTTNVLTAVNGVILVNGASVANITGATLKIDCSAAAMDAVVGSVVSPDVQRGRIKVSGQLTAYYQDGTMSALFDNATSTSAVIVVTDDSTAASDFIAFSLSAITLTGDSGDDGEKGIIRTYPFTAELNASGGAALANDQTIISIQDSQAA